MHSIFYESIDGIDLPPAISDISYSIVPSGHANVDTSGSSITLPNTPRCSHMPILFLSHDEERSQGTFSDSEDITEEHTHDKRTCAAVDRPHAFDTVVHGNPCFLGHDTNICGKPSPFHISPGMPRDASIPPMSRRVSASVARRNRLFALDDNSGVVTHADELSASEALPSAEDTEGPSSIELDGEVRKADHVLGGTLERWTESEPASLKTTNISIQRDNPTSKVNACITIR